MQSYIGKEHFGENYLCSNQYIANIIGKEHFGVEILGVAIHIGKEQAGGSSFIFKQRLVQSLS